MAGGYGLQFQPGLPNGEGASGQQRARGRVQAPVQVLSTRLPKFFGGGAIAPQQLLEGAGGMGAAGTQTNPVAQALAQLAGLPPNMQPSATPSLPGRGGAAPPVPMSPRAMAPSPMMPGLQPPSVPSGGFNPPPPMIRPGAPNVPPPISVGPDVGADIGPKELQPQAPDPGYGDWIRRWRDINNMQTPDFGGDSFGGDRDIKALAYGLFR